MLPRHSRENPIVFLDVSLADQYLGQIKIELFMHLAPRTSEIFRQYCTGETIYRSQPVGYKNVEFTRILKESRIEVDALSLADFRKPFPAESLHLCHNKAGLVCMSLDSEGQVGSNFYISVAPLAEFDGQDVICGEVYDEESLATLKKLEKVPVNLKGEPKLPVIISECGEY